MAPMSQAGCSQTASVLVPAPPWAPQITSSRRCHPWAGAGAGLVASGSRPLAGLGRDIGVLRIWLGRLARVGVLGAVAGRRLAARFFGGDAEELQQPGGGDAVDVADADDAAGELVAAGEFVGLGAAQAQRA